MKVVNNKQMHEIDQAAIEDYGIPGLLLMENAALSVIKEVLELRENGTVLVFCGQGNNGGDGFVIARHLFQKNFDVEVFIVGGAEKFKGDAKINYDILDPLGVKVTNLKGNDTLKSIIKKIQSCDIVLDCLFGTGLYREVTGIYKEVIGTINKYSPYTIAVDIPSGINGDSGKKMGEAIEADTTVTFALPKIGNLLYPGANYCGDLKLASIGIPHDLLRNKNSSVFTLNEKEAMGKLPHRIAWSNKGTYGKVTLLAGSKNMPGAAILAGKGAYRIGAGLVRIVIPESIKSIVQQGLVEAINFPYVIEDSGYIINTESLEKIKTDSSVIGIGPGLGQENYALELMKAMMKSVQCPIVIDADGINLIAKNMELLKMCHGKAILTPHIGEMSRLTGKSIDIIKENPIEVATGFSKDYDVICVLKDARTIVTMPDGKVYINQTGNDGMSTAGSGDVLTGIICGLIAQGASMEDAAIVGVYLHGKAGDNMIKITGKRALMASDLCNGLGEQEGFI